MLPVKKVLQSIVVKIDSANTPTVVSLYSSVEILNVSDSIVSLTKSTPVSLGGINLKRVSVFFAAEEKESRKHKIGSAIFIVVIKKKGQFTLAPALRKTLVS
jgi:hypothetical protein